MRLRAQGRANQFDRRQLFLDCPLQTVSHGKAGGRDSARPPFCLVGFAFSGAFRNTGDGYGANRLLALFRQAHITREIALRTILAKLETLALGEAV